MAENRVVEGRMLTPEALARRIEGDDVLEVDSIEDADRQCPECEGDVLEIVYMPSITELVTGWKCQNCSWQTAERD